MKHLKKTFVSALLAVAMLITCFLSLGSVSAAALSPEYDGSASIYYLFDYYPTMSKMQMAIDYPDYDVTYDRQLLTESSLTGLVRGNYFFNLAGEIFVVDIKLFQPSASILYELFYQLKQWDCVTIFVSTYASSSYTDTSFLTYVDEYVESDFSRISTFMENMLENVGYLHAEENLPMRDISFVIDSYALGSVYASYGSVDALVANSPFVRRLLDELAAYFAISMDGANLIAELAETYGIKIYIQTGTNTYADISSDDNGEFIEYAVSQLETLAANESGGYNHVCGLGITSFTSDFYNLMKDGEGPGTSVYYIEGDPVVYTEDGLEAISDVGMRDSDDLDEVTYLSEILSLYLD